MLLMTDKFQQRFQMQTFIEYRMDVSLISYIYVTTLGLSVMVVIHYV